MTKLRQWHTHSLEKRMMVEGPEMAERLITVVETREFARRAETRMSEQERQDFIAYIAGLPEDGAIMRGTGGVRKSRWGHGARGKSGGVRIIYYYHSAEIPIFLLTVFAKNERDNLTRAVCNVLRHLTTELVTAYQRRQVNEPRTQRR